MMLFCDDFQTIYDKIQTSWIYRFIVVVRGNFVKGKQQNKRIKNDIK
jgi:hypothetical protein